MIVGDTSQRKRPPPEPGPHREGLWVMEMKKWKKTTSCIKQPETQTMTNSKTVANMNYCTVVQ